MSDDELEDWYVSRWYRLEGHTPVRLRSRQEMLVEWARREDGRDAGVDPYRVARTELGDDLFVSTVFLGLDHQWMPDGPPLLFETMVFGGDDDDERQERYSTWEQAVAGHDQIVAAVRAEMDISTD